MVGSVDKRGRRRAPKRPVPIIEGTATEVAVEPVAAKASPGKDEAAAKPARSASASPKTPASKTPASKTPASKMLAPKMLAPKTPASKTSASKTSAPKTSAAKPLAAKPLAAESLAAESLATKPAPRRPGYLSHFVAGIGGGVVGAGALALAWGYLPANEPVSEPVEAPDFTPLQDRIAKIEAASPDHSAALAKLQARLGDLEGRRPETPPEISALAGRVSQLEASLKSMAEAAMDGGSVADAAMISHQIGEAERRLDAKIATALTGEKSADASALEALQKEIAGIDAKLGALAEAELNLGDAAHLVPEVAGLDERLVQLESTIRKLREAVDRDAEDSRAATLAIAFANLRAAVSEGRPYVTELGTLASLSPGTGDLGELLEYDDKGIPTIAELTRSFELAKDKALAAPAAVPDDTMLGRLMASAESLVKIRRIDADAEGDGPDAVLARAAAQMKQGDLAATVKEVATLQGTQKAAFATWLDQARARLGAGETLQRLENILLVSLGGSRPRGLDQTDEQN